jgi:predicted phage terminase large subunit-like protein
MSTHLALWRYFSECFVPFQELQLPLKDLHKGACDTLEKALLGELHKSFICINIPPRVGKTKLLEASVTWMFGNFPDSQFIYTSYSNMLAGTSSKYVQEVMKSKWYEQLFDTRLGKIQQADHFTTERGGMMHADGVGGALTGLGAGLKRKAGGAIYVDDPSKPDQALSAVESEKLRFWFENTLKSRRNSSQWTPIVVCMQRLDADDLTGFILENYPNDVHHIKFSGFVDGKSTIPETNDTESMLASQRVNPFAFAAQICQEPIILGGNLIKLADFRYYPYGQPPKIEHKIMTCDTALKAKTANDWSVIQCWGRSEKRAFLLDQIRGKWEPAELIKNVRSFYEKHHKSAAPVAYMAVEEAAAGTTLLAELRKRGIPARGIVRSKDKVTRVMDMLPYQATGMVWLPRGAPWLLGYEAEIAQFRKDGKSTKDDQVDPTADGVTLLLGKGTSILSVVGEDRGARAKVKIRDAMNRRAAQNNS